MNYLKSPFNYTGQKYPILDQIFNYFPKEVDTFYDLFCGGGSVFINVDYNNIVINDIITPLIKFYKELKYKDYETLSLNISFERINKDDAKGYQLLRESFNITKDDPYKFFCLVSFCTNNLGRFNKSGGFNQTFGKRTVNKNTLEKLELYSQKIKTQNIQFYNKNFYEFDFFNKNDFVYLDPPYFYGSDAGYNQNWNILQETILIRYLELLNKNNIKFAMSNTSFHKGVENESLKKICEMKNIKIINIDHNYDKVSRSGGSLTQEILVINY